MRILFPVFHFPPLSGGGAVLSYEIAKALIKEGNSVTILVPDVEWEGEKFEPDLSEMNIIRVPIPTKKNIKIAARSCKNSIEQEGIKILNKNNFDLIFTIFHPFHLIPNAATSLAKKFQIPIIIKIDDAIYLKASGLKSIQRKIEKYYSSKVLKYSTKIFVVNQETKDLIKNYYDVNSEKINIIPNGVNIKKFERKTSVRQKIVIFSGVMYYHRGLDILLEVIPKIIKKIPNSKFIFLGEGPEMNNLKKIVKEIKIESNVKFTGWINRERIVDFLNKASIGIGPLKKTDVTKNALPIKVLEYMASSLPLIAAKGTLSKEILIDEKNGFFIKDKNELVEKIIYLLENNNDVNKMGQESYNMVQKFSWNSIIKKIMNSFQEIQ